MKQIQAQNFDGANERCNYDRLPNTCPICHNSITPKLMPSPIRVKEDYLRLIFRCPNEQCQELFIGYYKKYGNAFEYDFSRPSLPQQTIFSKEIEAVSSSFIKIYNEAEMAESSRLTQIEGMGYRKAFEFLIKDFLIHVKPDEKEAIKKMLLAPCIKMIDNPKLNEVAKRVAWLGNDETHYERKWEDKDINDLKRLIDISVKMIEMELLTEKYIEEMPDKTKVDKSESKS